MAKTRAIVKRRKAIRNIRKITRTMELIATARFKKAMDRAVQAAAYTKKISELVSDLSRSAAASRHPLLETREKVGRSVLLVLTSNRGLCGGYNGNILRAAFKSQAELNALGPINLEVAGKRGLAVFKFRNDPVSESYLQFEDKPSYDEVERLADRYIEWFQTGKIDRLDVVYTRFLTMGRQIATATTLLPMASLAADTETPAKSAAPTAKPAGEVDYDFMPSASDILSEIVPASFKARLFKCFLDAAVSEQIARMVAMKGATENAGNLIKALSMKYNRARQAQITTELSEIIGTAEALK